MFYRDLGILKHVDGAVLAKEEGMGVRIRGEKENNIKSNQSEVPPSFMITIICYESVYDQANLIVCA